MIYFVLASLSCVLGYVCGAYFGACKFSPCDECGSITAPRRHGIGLSDMTLCKDGDGCRARAKCFRS